MNRLTKCQIAELIEDTLTAQGFREKPAPFRWWGRIFGSLFESSVPMESMTLRQARSAGLLMVILLPFIIAGILLTAPIEIARALRASAQNDRMKALLPAGGAAPGAGEAASGDERVIVDYRIENEGQAILCGTALVAASAERRELLGFTVHRSQPPKGALDGDGLRSALAGRGSPMGEVCRWQWNLKDPYELVERPARPW